MQNKYIEKHKESFRELEKKISPVLVVNNNALKPYVESFQYFPENIYQQPLGILLGFFEIKEYSEDSAYIVNFLNSVLKKEYYINPKRPVTESLDNALHKINVALSELAKHGNVNWLGKLDGAVCILEKNNLHFSVAGEAKVLLCRKHAFTDISEGLTSEIDEPHPLKTFVNVSSGRLENKDKVLITSNDIFQVISLPQLTKNVERFSEEQFVQFIRTALSNELEMASVIVVDASNKKTAAKKTITVPEIEPLQQDVENVFSQKTFAKTSAKHKLPSKKEILPIEKEEPLAEETYTDKKTGHIYIQSQEEELPTFSPWQEKMIVFKEHAWDFFYGAKQNIRRNTISFKKTLRIFKDGVLIKIAQMKKPSDSPEQIDDFETAFEDENKEHHVPVVEIKQPTLEELHQEASTEIAENLPAENPTPKEPAMLSEIKPAKQIATTIEKIERPEDETEKTQLIAVHHHKFSSIFDEEDLNIGQKKSSRNFGKFIPDFAKIKNLFKRFNSKQKALLILVVVTIFVLPLLLNKIFKSKNQTPVIEAPKELSLAEILANDKNIQLSSSVSEFANISQATSILLFEGNPFVIANKTIYTKKDGKEQTFNIPLEQNETISSTAFMQDLSMIIILTNQKRILSFSPISEQFKVNNIQIPDTANLKFIGTYLTYLYITDPTSNQVYRYPRADGGFGEKSSWLKKSVSLENISALTIDDSIYFVQNNHINKLFKGQIETVNFENSKTPITFSNIFTTIDLSDIYVLDAKNARVIVYTKNGEIVKQYFDESFKNATSLIADEKTSSIYLTTSNSVLKLSI